MDETNPLDVAAAARTIIDANRYLTLATADATRGQIGIVIFDSSVPVGSAQAVYVEAVAAEVDADERESAIATFSARAQSHGAGSWSASDVEASARLRLFRATAAAHFLLGANDQRIAVDL